VGYPGAVEAVVGLAGLVRADLFEGVGVRFRVLAVGDCCCHAADGHGAALVAGPDELFGVGAHEGLGHGHLAAVGQDEPGAAGAEVLDEGEDVVPAAGVQAGGVVAQFVEDFLHFERGGDGFDQHGGADGALRDAEQVLGEDEDVVPEPGLEVVLDLGQVEVRALALGQEAAGVVEEEQAEVHDAASDRGAVDEHVLFGQVPAAGTDHDGGQFPGGAELVFLALRGLVKSIRRSRASVRFSWPLMTLRQVGVEESSMSASQTFAPEFRALMVIFLSTGPVISTRRSSSPGPGERRASDGSLRMSSVSRRNRGSSPAADVGPTRPACLQQLLPSLSRGPVQFGNESSASGVKTSFCRFMG
jgi:hypothetical protein